MTAATNPRTAPAAASHFGPRIRFNWGYHDGAQDQQRGLPDRRRLDYQVRGIPPLPKDAPYVAGYGLGWDDAELGHYAGDSTAAWERHSGKANPSAFTDERVEAPAHFDPRSFRTLTHDDGTQLTVGCPVGHWHPGKPAGAQCDVPMRVQRIRHPKGTASNPLLALLNPGRRDEQLGTALYEIVYQHARDGDRSPPRKHVFDRPDGVTLWILNDYQVLLQASGQELVGWFTPSGRRVR